MPEGAPDGAAAPLAAPPPLIATYRLQFHRAFPLQAALRQLDYFAALGISHLYASPLLQARRGSLHGYDVTDPTRLNPELGEESDLHCLASGLQQRGLGLIVDLVPNHMAADRENRWWWSVLTYGRDSPFAAWFDIDWKGRGLHRNGPGDPSGRVLLPVLGAPLATVLARGELRVELAPPPTGEAGPRAALGSGAAGRGEPLLRYYQGAFPLNPAPPVENLDPQALRRWLMRQPYRLSYWRTASQQINYRRFFAINELVGFRVEVPEAMQASHSLVADWLRRGWVQGLRIDHIDGLFDPALYLTRLRELVPGNGPVWVEKILAESEPLPAEWPIEGTTGYDFLALCNRLQVDAEGHAVLLSGYRRFLHRHIEFASVTYGLKRHAVRSLFHGELRNFSRGILALARLSTAPAAAAVTEANAQPALLALAASYPVYRTYANRLGPQGPELRAEDRAAAAAALHGACARQPDLDPSAVSWIASVLAAQPAAGLAPEHGPRWLRFLQRWQQFTAPVMAKGQEDTALYVYAPLASLNEVGGDPAQPALSPSDWHAHLQQRQRHWPRALNATSTHDTKRSEDVRARLSVLSEIPALWLRWVRQWSRWNRPLRRLCQQRPAPSPNAEYLYYQTLVGAWPLDDLGLETPGRVRPPQPAFVERMGAYMRKAAREATIETQWTAPNQDYERALSDFIAGSLDADRSPSFLAAIRAASRQLAPAGAVNSLALLALKALAPGVPDFYQGCERWCFTLVDPDNRGEVEFDSAARLLQRWQQQPPEPAALLEHWGDGEIKLWLTARLLHLRRRHAALGPEGEYLPVSVAGAFPDRVVAFYRRSRTGSGVLVAVPRGVAAAALAGPGGEGKPSLAGFDWGDTRLLLPPVMQGEWRQSLGADPSGGPTVAVGTEILLSERFRPLPLAVLERP